MNDLALSLAYDVLGVSIETPMADVRRAYRRRAREAHPDTGGSAEAFRVVAKALAIIEKHRAERPSLSDELDDLFDGLA